MTEPMTINDLSSIRMILCEHCGNKRCAWAATCRTNRRYCGTHERLLRSLNPRRPNKPL